MKPFERDATSAFKILPQLRWAAVYSHGEFVPLVGAVAHGCVVYVFARDERSGDGPVRVDAWVAPPHPPDDGLDSLMVGFQIRIAESWNVTDDFLPGCAARVQRLQCGFDGLAAAAARELTAPAFESRRLAAYRYERELFDLSWSVSAESALDVKAETVPQVAQLVVEGEAAYSDLERECERGCALLLAGGQLSRDLVCFYETDSRWMGESVAGHAYVDALMRHAGPLQKPSPAVARTAILCGAQRDDEP